MHYLALVVNLGGVGFVVFDGSFLVPQYVPYRFHDGSMLDRTGRT